MSQEGQQRLPFEWMLREHQALLRSIEYSDIAGMSPGRRRGVAELLQRLILIPGCNYTQDEIVVRASVTYLSACLKPRAVVSVRTVQNWAKDAIALGLLERDVMSAKYGGREWNTWKFQLSTVRQLVGAPGCTGVKRGETFSPPGGETFSPPEKECITGNKSVPGPGKPVPIVSRMHSEESSIAERPRDTALRDALLQDIPMLREASAMKLRAAPCSELTHYGQGVFQRLEVAHLTNAKIIQWHLEQLSIARPFCGSTEADLLLTISAAKYAAELPACDVQKNRVAIFVSTVSHGSWRRALNYIGWARKLLDHLVQHSGRGAYWLDETHFERQENVYSDGSEASQEKTTVITSDSQ